MILQKILFPTEEICKEEELFYHRKNEKYEYNTYFNSFSLGKWRKYTDLSSLQLVLILEGSMTVSIYHATRNGADIEAELLATQQLNSGKHEIEIPNKVFLSEVYTGIVYFVLDSKSENAVLIGGWYQGNSVNPTKKINLAIDICTFHREQFIERNIRLISERLISLGNIEVFISDNGQSLEEKHLSTPKIHIYNNKNVGGVGGFTRGLLEILKRDCFTHILIMDDDVVINPDAIEMMVTFLSIRKDIYEDMTIGGAMFLLNRPSMQYESGASWINTRVVAHNGLLDMRSPVKVILNEEETEPFEYFAWWFSCFPVSVVTGKGLPLPIFVHMDDIEYGLRNNHHLVTLNGINVWHEDFDNKFTGMMEYYDQRNSMLVAALHKPDVDLKHHKKLLFYEITRQMMKQRHKYARMRLLGAEDYLKGIDWLKSQDGEVLHQSIMKMNYTMLPIEEFDISKETADQKTQLRSWEKREIESIVESDVKSIKKKRAIISKIEKIFCGVFFNGLFLPSKRNSVIAEPNPSIMKLFRANRVINYDLNGKAFETHRDLSEVIQIYREYRRISKVLDRNYQTITNEYRERINELESVEFWKNYLSI